MQIHRFCLPLLAVVSLPLIAGSPSPGHVAARPWAQAERYSAAVAPQDKVFPTVITGDGFEAVMVLLNMSSRPVDFKLDFWNSNAERMPVTFRTYPKEDLVTTAAAEGTLLPGQSFNFALFDNGGKATEGWAMLTYDDSDARLGGYALVRRKPKSGDFNVEALVPLSSRRDNAAFLPVDNIQGFETLLAVLNPGSSVASVLFTFLNLDGEVMLRRTLDLKPGEHASFSVPEVLPQLAGKLGTVHIQSDSNELSAAGMRINTSTGAIATVPLMNWSGIPR